MSTMHLDIVSAEEEIFSGEVKNIIAAATMGEVGIYLSMHYDHAIKAWRNKTITEEDAEHLFFISGEFRSTAKCCDCPCRYSN